MGKRGPKRLYPYEVAVQLTEEQHRYVTQLAVMQDLPRGTVIRALVDKAIEPLRGRPIPQRLQLILDEKGYSE